MCQENHSGEAEAEGDKEGMAEKKPANKPKRRDNAGSDGVATIGAIMVAHKGAPLGDYILVVHGAWHQAARRPGNVLSGPLQDSFQVKSTRLAEQTAWQALPVMLTAQRCNFGLNAMLGSRQCTATMFAFDRLSQDVLRAERTLLALADRWDGWCGGNCSLGLFERPCSGDNPTNK